MTIIIFIYVEIESPFLGKKKHVDLLIKKPVMYESDSCEKGSVQIGVHSIH